LIAQIAILTFDDSNELDSFIAFCLLNWLGMPRMFDGSTYASERARLVIASVRAPGLAARQYQLHNWSWSWSC
jgi:hypothetical protein